MKLIVVHGWRAKGMVVHVAQSPFSNVFTALFPSVIFLKPSWIFRLLRRIVQGRCSVQNQSLSPSSLLFPISVSGFPLPVFPKGWKPYSSNTFPDGIENIIAFTDCGPHQISGSLWYCWFHRHSGPFPSKGVSFYFINVVYDDYIAGGVYHHHILHGIPSSLPPYQGSNTSKPSPGYSSFIIKSTFEESNLSLAMCLISSITSSAIT